MMKNWIIRVLLKLLEWLGWSPFHIPIDLPIKTIDQTDMECYELRFEHEIKYPQHAHDFDKYVEYTKNSIPHEMAKKMINVIEKNMHTYIQYEGDPYCPYPVIRSKLDVYIKK